jgi:hypothetical protein
MQHPVLGEVSLRWLATCVLACACTGGFSSDPPSFGGHREPADASSSTRDEQSPSRVNDADAAGAAEDASAGGTGGSSPNGRAGAGGRAGSGAVSGEPPCDAVAVVLLPHCGGGSCHSNPTARIGDWAVGRDEAESFVDVPSVRNVSCGLIIDSADPSQSLLLRKLTGDFPSPMCGGLMPVSGGDLSDQEIACMGSWLQQFQR